MAAQSGDLLRSLLRDVSRSFYLTLRVLPGGIRRQIGLAYLLARATDTIADTDAVPMERRLAVLAALRDKIDRGEMDTSDLDAFVGHQTSPGEQRLLQRLSEALSLLRTFSEADQNEIRTVLRIIISGQELDIQRFAQARPSELRALTNDRELDDYTFRVAGCVGEFWTRMCRAHLFPRAPIDEGTLLANGVRFGKGLQLVNILRDLPADLRLGRCYLPSEALETIGLKPQDLLEPTHESKLRKLYDGYLDRAHEHLQAGWDYTNSLPFGCVRVRLACAWPILIGVRTVSRLRTGRILDPTARIKISRDDVRAILLQTVLNYPWPARWRRLWQRQQAPPRNTLPQAGTFAK